MTDEQKKEVSKWIDKKLKEPRVVLVASKDGYYIGEITEDKIKDEIVVTSAPPNDDDWIWDPQTSTWKCQYFYDSTNTYTKRNNPNAVGFTYEAKPDHPYFQYTLNNENNTWERVTTKEALNKYKKEISDDLICSFVKMLTETISTTDILEQLKNLPYDQTAKLSIIENSILDVNKVTSIEDIDEIYELTRMIIHNIYN